MSMFKANNKSKMLYRELSLEAKGKKEASLRKRSRRRRSRLTSLPSTALRGLGRNPLWCYWEV